MKKAGLVILLLVLSGCRLGPGEGGYELYEKRNLWVEEFNTYPIVPYDNGTRLVKTEYVNETSIKKNETQTAFVGYSVVSDKIYKVEVFEDSYLKANKRGIMNSASIPDIIDPGKAMQILGTVNVKGENLRMLKSSLDDFVFLVRDDGSLYNEMGQIRKNNRLSILDAEFLPTPDDVRMLPVKNTKTNQTKPVKGFDIKYEGVKADRMVFTYFDYSLSQDGKSGEFENFSFPLKQSLIDIYGVKIRVLHADENKLDYILMDI